MAEDSTSSPHRARKLSWAEMVDEEEEQMAKKAYEAALKEKEVGKKKKTGQKKKSNRNLGARQSEGIEQKTTEQHIESVKIEEPQEVKEASLEVAASNVVQAPLAEQPAVERSDKPLDIEKPQETMKASLEVDAASNIVQTLMAEQSAGGSCDTSVKIEEPQEVKKASSEVAASNGALAPLAEQPAVERSDKPLDIEKPQETMKASLEVDAASNIVQTLMAEQAAGGSCDTSVKIKEPQEVKKASLEVAASNGALAPLAEQPAVERSDKSVKIEEPQEVKKASLEVAASNVVQAPLAEQPAVGSSDKAHTVQPQLTSKETHFNWRDMDSKVSSMSILEEELKQFMSFRDDFKMLVDDRNTFYKFINEKLKDALIVFDEHQESAIREDKIGYWKSRGLIFMESPQYAQHAVDAFTKAVKLEPSSIECWNNLGDCYGIMGDYEMSRKCFQSALDQEKNVVSLQNLSILTRLKNPREIQDINDGIDYAKEALKFDVSCSKSWTILGNAYMAAFFASAQNDIYINKALHAYKQAEKGGSLDFETCFNKFGALKYLELYEEALNTLLPSLTNLDFEWKTAQKSFRSLVDYLSNVQELINKKGKIRAKKRYEYLKLLCTRIPSEEEEAALTHGVPRITGIVIWILSPDDSFPYTVGLMTETEEVWAVSIFNLSTGKGFHIGDIMNIPMDSKSEVVIHTSQHARFQFHKVQDLPPNMRNFEWEEIKCEAFEAI